MNKTLLFSLFTGFKRDNNSVKNTFSATLITMLLLFFGTQVSAQIPGNPFVDAGPDQTVDCSTGGCADLSAIFLQIGETNTYTVSSIDFLPPSDFQGLGNQLNTAIDDAWTPVNQLPFDFCFFGAINTQYQVGSNGTLRFDVNPNDTGGGSNAYSFTANLPNNVQEALAEGNIFSPVHDIDPSVSDTAEIGFEVQGVAPNRVLIVAYSEVPMFLESCHNLLATQMIVLYETTNIIDVYILQKQACTAWQNGVAAVGIQNNAGTVGFVPPGRNTSDSPWDAFLEAWRFTPAGPSIVDFAWLDSTGTVIGTTPNLNVCPSGTQTYTAKVTYTSCNGDIVVVTDDVVVTSNATFSVSLGPDISTCGQSSATLTANLTGLDPADATFLWSTGATTQSITVNTSGTYFVDVTGTDGCTIRDTVVVTLGQTPLFDLGANINSCLEIGNTVVLDATPSNIAPGSATYVWRLNGTILPAQTGPTLIPTATGTYMVTVTNGTCVATDTITITPVDFSVNLGPDQITCLETPLTLNANQTVYNANQVTFVWTRNGTVIAGATGQTINVTQAGTYMVTVTAGVCVETDTVVISARNDIQIDLGPDITTCLLDNVVLDASPSNYDPNVAVYQWSLNGTVIAGETNPTLVPSQAGTYSVIVTIGICTAIDSVQIIPANDIQIDLGDDIQSCLLDPIILDASPSNYDPASVTYQWSLNGTVIAGETNATLSVTQLGTYSVIVTAGICTATDSIIISAGDPILVDLGPDFNSCITDPITLDATPSNYDPALATYVWSLDGTVIAGETNATLVVTQNGTYTVVVTIGGCTGTDSITINPGDPILIDLGADFESCFVTNQTLDASPSNYDPATATYQWFLNGNEITGETNATLDINQVGTYTVIVSIGSCQATDTIVISPTNFTVDLGEDFETCFDGPVVLTSTLTVFGENEATYQWFFNGNEIAGETNSTLTILLDGTYMVIATVGNCQATDTIIVSPGNLTVDLGQDIMTCFENTTVLLTGNAQGTDLTNATYAWFLNGAQIVDENESTLIVTGPGTYTVTVTVGSCVASDDLVISLVDFNVDLGADFDSCFDSETVLNASITVYDVSEATFEWYLNGTLIEGQTTSTLNITEPGDYSVIANVGLCTAEDVITVSASDPLNVSLGDDIETCPNEENIITASTSEVGITYQWFLNGDILPNETGGSITVSLDGNTVGSQIYSVIISSGSCTGTDSVEVSLYNGGNCVISQGISPNGDGLNDSFDLGFLKNRFGSLNLKVYNRYGTIVFELDNYTDEWRGQSDAGKDLPTGTYYYVLNIDSTNTTPANNNVIEDDQKTGWIYLNQEPQ